MNNNRFSFRHLNYVKHSLLACLRLFSICFASLLPWAGYCQYETTSVVKTIADLQNVDTSSFSTNYLPLYYVADYYTPTFYDYMGRGGGMFRWWPSSNSIPGFYGTGVAADGGRFIACTNSNGNTNGVWERLLQGETPNVKMWGAHGDGIHDDTVAIQNAINAAGYGNSYELQFPYGTYLVSNTIVFYSGLHLRGDSVANCVILMSSNSQADILETHNAKSALSGGAVDWDHWLKVENLKLYFQGVNTNNGCLVVCMPGEANTIQNIQTSGGGYGVRCLGAGAPGLRLRDVTVNGAAIGGVSIECLPDGSQGSGVATLQNISGDNDAGQDPFGIASLVRITAGSAMVEIDGLKAETYLSEFGGGVIRWLCPPVAVTGATAGGWYLNVKHASFSGIAPNFVSLVPTATNAATYTPSVLLQSIRTFSTNLIGDYVCSNFLNPTYFAASQVPLSYQGYNGWLWATNEVGPRPPYTRCVVGNTAFSQFTPTQVGWYRVMQPMTEGSAHLAGELTIAVEGNQSTELQIDVSPYAYATPYLQVVRPAGLTNPGWPAGPAVSQARAFKYWDAPASWFYEYVDIFCSNTNQLVTLSHQIQGAEGTSTGGVQLISPVYWLGSNTNTNAYLPSNASCTNVLLYQ